MVVRTFGAGNHSITSRQLSDVRQPLVPRTRYVFCATAWAAVCAFSCSAERDELADVEDVVERRRRCEDQGGVVIAVTLLQPTDDVPGFAIGAWPDEEGTPFCVPRGCASLQHSECAQVSGWILRHLAGDYLDPLDRRIEHSELGVEGKAITELPADVEVDEAESVVKRDTEWIAEARAAYAAMQAQPERLDTASSSFRAVVVGWHGPLSLLAVEHMQEAATIARLPRLDVALYGQCYRCVGVPACDAVHVPGLAVDRHACDWFHGAAVDGEELRAAARELGEQRPRPSVIVCLGVLFCHFLFEAGWVGAPRLQLLCMSPLKGVPMALAPTLLRGLAERASAGEAIYSTNVVTAALLAYHLGGDGEPHSQTNVRAVAAPALPLLPRSVHFLGLQAAWSVDGKEVLLAQSFLYRHSHLLRAFIAALRRSWPHGVREQSGTWDYNDASQVADVLRHRAAVYVPEVPYKNLFNEFYAMRLPLFVPSLRFLARLWPRVRGVDDDSRATYDGWFDRNLPHVRLGAPSRSSTPAPEPFDLDADGEAKVLHWARFADYYHFPGVLTFAGVAELVEALSNADLETSRAAMAAHFAAVRARAAAAFRAVLAP
eukprot:TRINITY_DN13619_c0_g4_i1.p1 TRINITY_DN13619_c0_g4~~TRINITY_DN13619_c0_g4_i1.p1  ORF type:complete len:603 (+),score=93.11 TRINITY_DN13619_c0_g4_i1:59-1867(+)